MELPLSRVLSRMEDAGIRLGLDVLTELSAELAERLESAQQRAHELAGVEFNLGSPKQVGEVLFERLELPVIKKTKSGPSTDASVLDKLATQEHELPKVLLEWRHDEARSTYAEVLPKAVGVDGRLHTRYLQTRTATGRLASADPNLQNIPIKTAEGRRVRQAFSAGAVVLVSADYSQVELRVLAHMSEDKILIDAFSQGQDIHRRTASELFGCRRCWSHPSSAATPRRSTLGSFTVWVRFVWPPSSGSIASKRLPRDVPRALRRRASLS